MESDFEDFMRELLEGGPEKFESPLLEPEPRFPIEPLSLEEADALPIEEQGMKDWARACLYTKISAYSTLNIYAIRIAEPYLMQDGSHEYDVIFAWHGIGARGLMDTGYRRGTLRFDHSRVDMGVSKILVPTRNQRQYSDWFQSRKGFQYTFYNKNNVRVVGEEYAEKWIPPEDVLETLTSQVDHAKALLETSQAGVRRREAQAEKKEQAERYHAPVRGLVPVIEFV